MGQYYKAYIEKCGVPIIMNSHTYNNGSKLMEHSYFGNKFVNAAYTLIENSPCKVAWVGDYSNDVGCSPEIYGKIWSNEIDNTLEDQIDVKSFFIDGDSIFGEGFLINHTKKQFIDLAEYVYLTGETSWIINPLPLLTSIGNGLGGGDYGSEMNKDMVGYWYMDEIEFRQTNPHTADYSNITEDVIFIER